MIQFGLIELCCRNSLTNTLVPLSCLVSHETIGGKMKKGATCVLMIGTRSLHCEKYLTFLVSPLALLSLCCFPRVSCLLIFASSESLVSSCNLFSVLSFSFSLLFLLFILLYIFSKVTSFSWLSGLCILLFLRLRWVYSASPLKKNSIPLLFLPLVVSRIPYPHSSF